MLAAPVWSGAIHLIQSSSVGLSRMSCTRRRNVVALVTACLLQLDRARGWLAAPAVPVHQRQWLRSSAIFSPGGRDVTPTGTGRRRKRQHATIPPLCAAPSTPAADSSAVAEHQQPRTAKKPGGSSSNNLQSVDFTTALLMSRELEQSIVPARVENAYQMDAHNVALQLRTLEGNMWLHVCWHPKGAR